MDDSTQLSGALRLAGLGYAVFPCDPARPGEPCHGVLWRRAATTDPVSVRRLWAQHPEGEPAIACGESGIVAIDIDEGLKKGRERHGAAGWAALNAPDATIAYPTRNGLGRHLLYAESRSIVGIDSTGKVAPDVDVRGLGGYVVCHHPELVTAGPRDLAPVPAAVAGRMRRSVTRDAPDGVGAAERSTPIPFEPPRRYFTQEQATEYVRTEAIEPLKAATVGERNHRLNASAMTFGHFVPVFWSVEQVTEGLAAIAEEIGLIPSEIGGTIRSGLRAGMREPYYLNQSEGDRATAGAQEGEGGVKGGDETDGGVDPVTAMLAEMLDTDGLDSIDDLEPVVKGWLWRSTVARINGKSTHGKSFVALDIAAHVATGRDWQGHRTIKGGVVYLIAEGAEGFRKRVRAWESYHETRMTGIWFLPRPVQIKGNEWTTLILACQQLAPSVIVLDTQARVTVGMNENDNTEMGIVVHQAEELKRLTGACVVFVHHLGHNGEEGRGATAIKAALQTEILVRREEQTVIITNPKQKDASDRGELKLDLHVRALGTDVDGEILDSCVLVPVGTLSVTVQRELFPDDLSEHTTRLIGIMMEVFNEGHGGTESQVRAVFNDRTPGRPDTKRKAFKRAWNNLMERGRLMKVEGRDSWRFKTMEEIAQETKPEGDAA